MPVAATPAALASTPRPARSQVAREAAASELLGPEQALTLLRALSDPIRLQVLQALAQGERCVCELTGELALAQSKLSFHLKVMKEAGLITARQQGRWVYYRLEPALLLALRDWLAGLSEGCARPAAPCS